VSEKIGGGGIHTKGHQLQRDVSRQLGQDCCRQQRWRRLSFSFSVSWEELTVILYVVMFSGSSVAGWIRVELVRVSCARWKGCLR
jgi:hypothetical protein